MSSIGPEKEAMEAAIRRAEAGELDDADPRALSSAEMMAWMQRFMGDASKLDPELRPYVQSGESKSIVWVKHPLVFQTFPSPLQANYALKAKKRMLAEYEAERRWHGYVFTFERPHRLTTLFDLWNEDRITRDELRDLVPAVWTDTELPHQFGDVPVWLFAAAGFVHDLDDCERPPWHPGDMVRVYRGSNAADPPGISWTTDEGRARWFAERFAGYRGPGVVFTGLAPAHKIRAYFASRNEAEVIIEPDDIVDLAHSGGVIKTLLAGPSQKGGR